MGSRTITPCHKSSAVNFAYHKRISGGHKRRLDMIMAKLKETRRWCHHVSEASDASLVRYATWPPCSGTLSRCRGGLAQGDSIHLALQGVNREIGHEIGRVQQIQVLLHPIYGTASGERQYRAILSVTTSLHSFQAATMSDTAERVAPSGDIAIVGMSCRFPGEGEGVDGFWQSISSGQCKSS